MQLLPGIEARGCALRIGTTLIISDLHIGYEEEGREMGVLLIDEQREYYRRELARVVDGVQQVILNGDVKHSFGTITKQEWEQVSWLLRWLDERATVTVVAGNHDRLLLPIVQKRGMELVDAYLLDNTLIVHGDNTAATLIEKGAVTKEEFAQCKTVVLGHEHPAIRLSDGIRSERAKCYLVGERTLEGAKKRVIVMPAFNPYSTGTDVLRERPLGPLLADFGGLSAFAVVDEQVLAFGELEKLRRPSG